MVELDRQGELTRDEVATFLRDFADELAADASAGGDREQASVEEPVPTIGEDDGEPTGRRTNERSDDASRTGESGDDLDEQRRPTDDRTDVETTSDSAAERITFVVGGDSATVTVPHTVDFEVEVESRSPMMSGGVSQQVGLDLSWEVDDPEDRELRGDEIDVS